MRRCLLLLLFLAACGRPLTEAERSFMAGLQPGLETDHIRIVEAPFVGLRGHERPVRPRSTCRERILPPPEGPTVVARAAGMAGFRRIWVNPDYYLADYLTGYPDELRLLAAMFFAHEMTHVWQWQQRSVTGYHPLRGASEHWVNDDPYLFDVPEETPDFLDYGYEQQASLVEEYVCCRALDPDGARTARLERILLPYLILEPISSRTSQPDVRLPWAGAEIRGICS
jgi:hypothetical protein